MKKDQNSRSLPPVKAMGLPKKNILRGRGHFERLFEGSVTVFAESHISMRFYLQQGEKPQFKVGFIVPKRLGKAVDRNYVKRIFKEAYRQNCHACVNAYATFQTSFYGVLMAKKLCIDFCTAEKEIINLLHRAEQQANRARGS